MKDSANFEDTALESLLGEVAEEIDEAEVYRKKSNEIKKAKIEAQYREIQDSRKRDELLGTIDAVTNDRKKDIEIAKQNQEYLESAKKRSMVFLSKEFENKVPYLPKNVILLGARSGQGKSTITANLAFIAAAHNQRVLIISNEEMANDIYNRITCLGMGIAYANHDKFTKEQINHMVKNVLTLSKIIKVIDDDYVGIPGATTTYESMKKIIDQAIDSNAYDVIIIDYYQQVSESSVNPGLDQFKVQAKFADYLNQAKKRSQAPIVLMMQMKDDREAKMSVKERIEGTKKIYNVGNSMIEAKIDYEKSTTEFYIAKSRFNEHNNTSVTLGYLKGKYVPYTDEFRQNVGMKRTKEKEAEMLGKVFKDKKEGE